MIQWLYERFVIKSNNFTYRQYKKWNKIINYKKPSINENQVSFRLKSYKNMKLCLSFLKEFRENEKFETAFNKVNDWFILRYSNEKILLQFPGSLDEIENVLNSDNNINANISYFQNEIILLFKSELDKIKKRVFSLSSL